MKKTLLVPAVLIIVLAAGLYFYSSKSPDTGVLSEPQSNKLQAHIYKSPNCGCCVSHSSYLRKNDFDVEVEAVSDMASIKRNYNIPFDMQSCHTTMIDGYFVEGHVPIEAINKLLSEKPDIDGITLPDMPAGSPGMPGVKREDFIIYSLKDGEASEFMRI